MLKTKLLVGLGLLLQPWLTYGDVVIQPPLPKPEYLVDDEGCFSDITNDTIPYDVDIFLPGKCLKLTCSYRGYIRIHSCDQPAPGCYSVPDLTFTFPRCCGEVYCDGDGYGGTYDQGEYDGENSDNTRTDTNGINNEEELRKQIPETLN